MRNHIIWISNQILTSGERNVTYIRYEVNNIIIRNDFIAFSWQIHDFHYKATNKFKSGFVELTSQDGFSFKGYAIISNQIQLEFVFSSLYSSKNQFILSGTWLNKHGLFDWFAELKPENDLYDYNLAQITKLKQESIDLNLNETWQNQKENFAKFLQRKQIEVIPKKRLDTFCDKCQSDPCVCFDGI